MHSIRPQLDDARRAYRTAEYPGDLAGELLGESRRTWFAAFPWRRSMAIGAPLRTVLEKYAREA